MKNLSKIYVKSMWNNCFTILRIFCSDQICYFKIQNNDEARLFTLNCKFSEFKIND